MGIEEDFAREATAADGLDPLARAALPRNDIGNAKRLEAAFGPDLIYVLGRGWGAWDGRRYDFDAGELMALSLAGRLQELLEQEAAAKAKGPVSQPELNSRMAESGEDEETAARKIRADRKRALMQFALACGNTAKINGALKQLAPRLRHRADELDATPYRVVAKNGVIDLDAIAAPAPEAEEPEERRARLAVCLGAHDRAGLPTRVLGCAYDPDAECPRWLAFLDLAVPDREARAFLQRCMGYLLAGRNSAQVALIMLGQGGNGKSTVAMAVHHVLGDYAAPCRIDLFMESKHSNAGAASPEEAVLPGARAYIASEPEPGATMSSSKIKGFTGGEPRQSRGLGKDPFTWRPSGTPLISLNRVPRISDESHGLWRRLMFLNFLVDLTQLPERKDFAAVERDLEAEASGILNWMIDGWIDYRLRGALDPPAASLERSAELRAGIDPVGEFLGDCTEAVSGGQIQSKELFDVFCLWAENMGVQPCAQKTFTRLMRDKGWHSTKSHGRMMWRGIDWRNAPEVGDLVERVRIT